MGVVRGLDLTPLFERLLHAHTQRRIRGVPDIFSQIVTQPSLFGTACPFFAEPCRDPRPRQGECCILGAAWASQGCGRHGSTLVSVKLHDNESMQQMCANANARACMFTYLDVPITIFL